VAASVYLETTIPSYLTAWRSQEIVMAARQQITRDWWDQRRNEFELFISQVVLDEASAGDPDAVARRLEMLADIPFVEPQPGFEAMAEEFMRELSLPKKAAADAVDIALAVANHMDFS
jgi:hypothetical protein